MGKLTVTTKVSPEVKAAGFDFAVVYKNDEDVSDMIACFKNRFDAIMFMHANRIKEETGVKTRSHSHAGSSALQRKETAQTIS